MEEVAAAVLKGFGVVALGLVALVAGAATAAGQQGIPRPPDPRAAIQGVVRDDRGVGVAEASVELRASDGREVARATTGGEGVFRLLGLAPGAYELGITREGFQPIARTLDLRPGESLALELTLVRLAPLVPEPRLLPPLPDLPPPDAPPTEPYRELPRRLEPGPEFDDIGLAPADKVFVRLPDRWAITMPDWDRYGREGEYPYVGRHWWDPYNRNRFKGDYPILGQRTFFVFTGLSDTLVEGRNLPTPSGVSAERPGSDPFFGRGDQYFPVTAVRLSFDLFRGDTAFRPIDWRIRVQPAFSLNYLHTRERGVVNPDVRRGATRLDRHVGLQEAFGEVKLLDIGPNYDFLSIRAGIQELASDFRGFLAVLEQPGIRLFGTLRSNRIEYNVAYFDLLEKDTNSVFNEFKRRQQQVAIANLYFQDAIRPGYTAQVSFHYNRDRASVHFDHNNVLVRPTPFGLIEPHEVRAYYAGWAGHGHFGRLNVSHAFYQAFGHDELNPLEAQRVRINAQMAAAELSVDFDWLRIKGTVFFASGDGDLTDGVGRGFDSIVDIPVFAGGPFSFWNQQGLRLPPTLTGLVMPFSLLPNLRTNKDEGQANFVNPGLILLHGGLDVEVTPKLRAFANTSYLRFHRPEPLSALLFQTIRPGIGIDYSVGAQYRPPLTENIVLVGGAAGLHLGAGMRDIFERNHLFSVFANLRLQF